MASARQPDGANQAAAPPSASIAGLVEFLLREGVMKPVLVHDVLQVDREVSALIALARGYVDDGALGRFLSQTESAGR